ncbi:protein-disulfide reductase DsbD N-terminal domain-containing protein [Mucilaginibacter sp. RS28]|uniref:Protein-disulfide reductase DsbD N-terminal domain-containing protein n=1 Tax=Mucilaginibacter straminoryzae TaxID=2932774 RepID=A0A9X2B7B9_9SPHI|nr:protein-disulfide reductase DsbD domain-containing protein [Mucilaginibacter straminoryzae]MCJ8208379.1 protein-disulfide reductase DsbD N-terminal domain-containing protein [Mucilaginibacter straminoryzae]
MKKLFFLIVLACFSVSLQAQILHPVKWSYAAKKLNATEAVVFFKATVDEGWHLYSQNVGEGGPVKTTFTFPASAEYTLIGKTAEPKPITKFEKAFNMPVSYFEKEVIFQQKVKLKKGAATVKGTLEYMTCNDKQCLPPDDVEFSIPVK